jgi:hypothetical protein
MYRVPRRSSEWRLNDAAFGGADYTAGTMNCAPTRWRLRGRQRARKRLFLCACYCCGCWDLSLISTGVPILMVEPKRL